MRNAICEFLGMDDLDSPGKRLRWARKRANFDTATAAAEAHGWKVPTYLGHENGDRVPSREKAKRYGDAFRVPWAWILEGGPTPGRRSNRAGPIPTVGEVAAGQWLDIDTELDPRDFEQFPITAHPDYPIDAQYGLIVKGTSINRIADAGSVLHCVDVIKAVIETHEDDVVIVERKRAQASQREVTAKVITRRGKMVVLMPESTDARWKPIEFDPSNRTDEVEVAVIGLVIGIYKPFRRRQR